ncbi:MAG: AAA family ATPase [Thiofilum sp.]|uniref:AAA family ATPase n=1 Tax=Thiofilum sp. TaxID=2212733 RepID=UPI0025F8EA4C|nr:AAA family ATPase [Thiofilum sp.]MBK8453930.1 AAA family ATPase [Thiofilum sp.]
MLKLPYGISNFYQIRTEGYYYLDRTHLIPELEAAGKQLIFLRPRRFGKSLLLSTLEHYYDINQSSNFNALFGELAIGQQPTDEHNRYLVLRWDFSAISGIGSSADIKASLFNYLTITLKNFTHYYQDLITSSFDFYPNDALASLQAVLSAVKASGHAVYLLIDEYDNFANEILINKDKGPERYKELLSGEGIFKTLFKIIKAQSTEGNLARVFITGVSPLVLSDMTSGYNVATNIFLDVRFHELCGIAHDELAQLVADIIKQCPAPADQTHLLATLQQYYNGYRFSYDLSKPRLYNPTLCFYFLQYYQLNCEMPFEMLDGNLAMDASRIEYMMQLPAGRDVIAQILDEQNPISLKHLITQFGVDKLAELNNNPDYMASLLYFFGVLTLVDIQGLRKMILKAPNLVVQALYIDEFKRYLLPESKERRHLQRIVEDFYQSGNLEPLANYLESKTLQSLSNRDYQWSNELTIKMAFLTPLFDDSYYMIDSEANLGRRYSDLIMIVRYSLRESLPSLYDFILEFKYLKLGDLNLTAEQIKQIPRQDLAQLPLVQNTLNQALTQLVDYRNTINSRYNEPQRLICIAVVALGFDRIVWQRLD